jgi:hypothetical protein
MFVQGLEADGKASTIPPAKTVPPQPFPHKQRNIEILRQNLPVYFSLKF